jgi:hypothetical protein
VGEMPRSTSDDQTLGALIDQAENWEGLATAAEAERAERAKADSQRRAERHRVDDLIAKTSAELAVHEDQVKAGMSGSSSLPTVLRRQSRPVWTSWGRWPDERTPWPMPG